MSEGCLRSFSRGIWVLLIDLFKVWMRIRVYGSAQALYCVANTLYWKSFKRQIFTHLTVLKHQNTKTSLYELSKNHWVFALFEIFGLLRKIIQSTVFNDHPVVHSWFSFCLTQDDAVSAAGKRWSATCSFRKSPVGGKLLPGYKTIKISA